MWHVIERLPVNCDATSAGSIPDSYDIYRYLNLVRYSIFDTRYFHRKCNFVYIFRGYLKRLRHKIKYYLKKKIMRHCGENEIPNFFRKCDFFSKIRFFYRKSDFSFIENWIFFPQKSDFFRKHTEFGGWSFAIYYFSKTYEIRCLVTFRVSLLHRLCRA